MMTQKGFVPALILIGILVVGLIATGAYYLGRSTSSIPKPSPNPIITSQFPKPSPLQNTQTPQPTAIPTPTPDPTVNWQFIDADRFTVSLPSGWKFNKLRGIDSYIGEFVGNDVSLSFDFGWYSNSLAQDNDPDHIVTYETIDGYKAKIVVPKVIGNGTTGVYFGDLGKSDNSFVPTVFNLYGTNLTSFQQETALKIFRTIRFKK